MQPQSQAPPEPSIPEPTADEVADFVRAYWSALPAADRAYLAHLRRNGGEPAHSLALGDRSAAGLLRVAVYGMLDAGRWEAASRAAVRLHRIETESGVPPIRLGPIEGFAAPGPQPPEPTPEPPAPSPKPVRPAPPLTGRALYLQRKAERLEARRRAGRPVPPAPSREADPKAPPSPGSTPLFGGMEQK